jgi:hypothetical protein
VCACVLAPRAARADDGGWWDWLWKFDSKFVGGTVDFHVLCFDRYLQPIRNAHKQRLFGCEEWFKNIGHIGETEKIEHTFLVEDPAAATRTDRFAPMTSFDPIKHEVDFRFGYFHNVGDRYDPPDPPTGGSINIYKLMGIYRYHLTDRVAVDGGLGFLWFQGDRFTAFSRGILTAGFIIVPIGGWRWFEVLPAFNYMPGGFTAADFGDPPGFVFNHPTEKNVSIAIGFDLRRIGQFR